jgi:hypothetical protein
MLWTAPTLRHRSAIGWLRNHVEGSRPWVRLARSVLILRSQSFRYMGLMMLVRLSSASASVARKYWSFLPPFHAWHRSCEESRRLEEIPGIGPIGATALVAESIATCDGSSSPVRWPSFAMLDSTAPSGSGSRGSWAADLQRSPPLLLPIRSPGWLGPSWFVARDIKSRRCCWQRELNTPIGEGMTT